MEKHMEGTPWPAERMRITNIFRNPPGKEDMTEIFGKLAGTGQSGTVILSDGLAETTPTMSPVNQLANKGGSSTINTPMLGKNVKAWEPLIDYSALYGLSKEAKPYWSPTVQFLNN